MIRDISEAEEERLWQEQRQLNTAVALEVMRWQRGPMMNPAYSDDDWIWLRESGESTDYCNGYMDHTTIEAWVPASDEKDCRLAEITLAKYYDFQKYFAILERFVESDEDSDSYAGVYGKARVAIAPPLVRVKAMLLAVRE